MTLTWREEMNLLNDDQLKRIAFAEKDSWGCWYNKEGNGGRCCIMGHILNLQIESTMEQIMDYRNSLQTNILNYAPLEKYYMDNFIHIEIIIEIQDKAKQLLKERAAKIQIAPDVQCERSVEA